MKEICKNYNKHNVFWRLRAKTLIKTKIHKNIQIIIYLYLQKYTKINKNTQQYTNNNIRIQKYTKTHKNTQKYTNNSIYIYKNIQRNKNTQKYTNNNIYIQKYTKIHKNKQKYTTNNIYRYTKYTQIHKKIY